MLISQKMKYCAVSGLAMLQVEAATALPLIGQKNKDFAIAKYEAADFTRSTDMEQVQATLNKANAPFALSRGANIITAPHLKAYSQKIVDKLYAHYTGPKPDIIVTTQIVADPYGRASVGFDGVIYVGSGLFDLAENEDEVAFVLAHELAHVIGEHFKVDTFTSSVEQNADRLAVTGVAGAAVANVDVSSNQNQITVSQKSDTAVADAAQTASTAYFVATEIAQTLVGPRFKNAHEKSADLIAMDLIERAGYNYNAATDFFDRAVERRQAGAQRVKELTNNWMETFKNTVFTTVKFDGQSISFNKKGAVQILKQYGNQVLKAGLFDTRDMLRSSHANADKRARYVLSYFSKLYPDAESPAYSLSEFNRIAKSARSKEIYAHANKADAIKLALVTNDVTGALAESRGLLSGEIRNDPYVRYTMYMLRRAQYQESNARKDLNNAIRNLEIALARPNATPNIYASLASEYARTQKITAARNVVKTAIAKFDAELSFLPVSITVEMRGGDAAKVQELIAKCQMQGTNKIRSLCKTAVETADAAKVQAEAGEEALPDEEAVDKNESNMLENVGKGIGKGIGTLLPGN